MNSPYAFCLVIVPVLAIVARTIAFARLDDHWKISAWDGCRDALATAVPFALVAPPIGLVLASIPTLLVRGQWDAIGAIVPLAIFSYLGGFVPAVVCGMFVGALRPFLSQRLGAFAAAVIGAVSASAFFAASGLSSNFSLLSLQAASGAIGGFILGWFCLRD